MPMEKIKTKLFDVAEHLDSQEMVAEYLAATLEDGDADEFIAALSDVARARGMSQLAKESGLSRESLYKTLSPGSKPRFETIRKIASALGVPLTIAVDSSPAPQNPQASGPFSPAER